MQDDLTNLAWGLAVSTIVYLLFTVMLSQFLGVLPENLLNTEFGNSFTSAWLTLGAILGIGDLLLVASFIGGVFSSTRY